MKKLIFFLVLACGPLLRADRYELDVKSATDGSPQALADAAKLIRQLAVYPGRSNTCDVVLRYTQISSVVAGTTAFEVRITKPSATEPTDFYVSLSSGGHPAAVQNLANWEAYAEGTTTTCDIQVEFVPW